jgi:site-specific DNA-methyltransferase (adenine-specific)
MLEVHVLFQQTGFAYEGHLVWDKGNPGLGYTIRYSHEDLLVFTKGKPPAPADALISVIRASRGDIDEHPHAKPPNVWRKIMRLMPGVVLDPFMGCGTMLEAAKSLQRQAIGIEIDESYCEMAAKRLIRTPRPLLIAPSVKHAPKRRQLL